MTSAYDFIVIGAGPSGCALASRLANTASSPSVLLLEAGGDNDGLEHLSGEERYNVAFQPNSPVNWSYKTEPQFGKQIDYSRGKGLGGSTAINFCGWVVGPKDDFEEWGRMMGNEAFGWDNVRRCLKRVERLHSDVPEGFDEVAPWREDHGMDGRVDLSYQKNWQGSVKTVFEAARQSGWLVNPDVNSGNPIGMGIGSACVHNGVRVTAKSAYLNSPPSNLTIVTEALVSRVMINGSRATGVETADGKIYTATKEVIVSGGAINSPQLLMLSGIGPRSELAKHGIECKVQLKHVGQNLKDHCFSTVGIVLVTDTSATNSQQTPSPMGWFKTDAVLTSDEFRQLPQQTKAHLSLPTVPTWEMATHTPFLDGVPLSPSEEVLSAIALIMNPQSSGSITLASNDPAVHPIIDPTFLSHPFDRRVAIEAMREMMRFFQAPVFKNRTARHVGWPVDRSDEAILDHFKQNLYSSWHMASTVRMGRDKEDSCVDSDFRIHGVTGLRVVDMSVCPFVPNNHTQSTAYILGEIAADKIIASHSLDEAGRAKL